jgi:hypothetical protein
MPKLMLSPTHIHITRSLGRHSNCTSGRKGTTGWNGNRPGIKILNSYHEQEMFSAQMEKPHGANTHHMLWRYTIKMCGTKKARMVCDRSSHQGTIMLGHL